MGVWIFILVLCMVPLFFYFTDSLGELFPQWKDDLPGKSQHAVVVASAPSINDGLSGESAVPGQWYQAEDEKGFAAWIYSDDMKFRISVGCARGAMPAIRVTELSGLTFPVKANLTFAEGDIPLSYGANQGNDLVGLVAVLDTVQLQNSQNQIAAQFTSKKSESGAIARNLSNSCN